uniref:Uncharacterized protein n=1 Tax=Pseudonaja textilis TaxID=8673 RepID=A0A670YUC9_PSETE
MTGNLHRYVTIPDFILPTAVTIILLENNSMAVANKLEIVHVAFTVSDGIFYHIYSTNSNKTKIMLRGFALLFQKYAKSLLNKISCNEVY